MRTRNKKNKLCTKKRGIMRTMYKRRSTIKYIGGSDRKSIKTKLPSLEKSKLFPRPKSVTKSSLRRAESVSRFPISETTHQKALRIRNSISVVKNKRTQLSLPKLNWTKLSLPNKFDLRITNNRLPGYAKPSTYVIAQAIQNQEIIPPIIHDVFPTFTTGFYISRKQCALRFQIVFQNGVEDMMALKTHYDTILNIDSEGDSVITDNTLSYLYTNTSLGSCVQKSLLLFNGVLWVLIPNTDLIKFRERDSLSSIIAKNAFETLRGTAPFYKNPEFKDYAIPCGVNMIKAIQDLTCTLSLQNSCNKNTIFGFGLQISEIHNIEALRQLVNTACDSLYPQSDEVAKGYVLDAIVSLNVTRREGETLLCLTQSADTEVTDAALYGFGTAIKLSGTTYNLCRLSPDVSYIMLMFITALNLSAEKTKTLPKVLQSQLSLFNILNKALTLTTDTGLLKMLTILMSDIVFYVVCGFMNSEFPIDLRYDPDTDSFEFNKGDWYEFENEVSLQRYYQRLNPDSELTLRTAHSYWLNCFCAVSWRIREAVHSNTVEGDVLMTHYSDKHIHIPFHFLVRWVKKSHDPGPHYQKLLIDLIKDYEPTIDLVDIALRHRKLVCENTLRVVSSDILGHNTLMFSPLLYEQALPYSVDIRVDNTLIVTELGTSSDNNFDDTQIVALVHTSDEVNQHIIQRFYVNGSTNSIIFAPPPLEEEQVVNFFVRDRKQDDNERGILFRYGLDHTFSRTDQLVVANKTHHVLLELLTEHLSAIQKSGSNKKKFTESLLLLQKNMSNIHIVLKVFPPNTSIDTSILRDYIASMIEILSKPGATCDWVPSQSLEQFTNYLINEKYNPHEIYATINCLQTLAESGKLFPESLFKKE